VHGLHEHFFPFVSTGLVSLLFGIARIFALVTALRPVFTPLIAGFCFRIFSCMVRCRIRPSFFSALASSVGRRSTARVPLCFEASEMLSSFANCPDCEVCLFFFFLILAAVVVESTSRCNFDSISSAPVALQHPPYRNRAFFLLSTITNTFPYVEEICKLLGHPSSRL